MDKFIPLSIPNFEGNEEKYVVDAIASTFVSTVGGYVSRFEKDLAVFLNVDNVAVCQSGTSALHLSMVDAGVKPGDVVLVPPLTFIAALNPVKYQFARKFSLWLTSRVSLCLLIAMIVFVWIRVSSVLSVKKNASGTEIISNIKGRL